MSRSASRCAQAPQLDVDDGANLLAAERVEYHDVVHPVDEFGPEMLRHHLHDRVLHGRIVRIDAQFLDDLAAEVRGHDDDGIAKIHRPTLAVGQPSVIEYLKQHVEHIRMRLLDFIEQDHAIRPAPHRFGEIPALFVSDVARAARRSDAPPNASP